MKQTAYVDDGIDFVLTVEIDPATGFSTLIGGQAEVAALNTATGASTAGTATITGAKTIWCRITPIAKGVQNIQVRAAPIGGNMQTVYAEDWVVKASA